MRSWGLVGLGLLLALTAVSAFKEWDFKKCATLGFCKRHRGRTFPNWKVAPSSVKLDGTALLATLLNGDAEGKNFQMVLAVYGDIVRLYINEPTANPPRYHVPDVLLPNFLSTVQAWKILSQDANQVAVATPNSSVVAVVSFAPFRVNIIAHNNPAVTINSRDLFNFEHRRTKEEHPGDCDGCWEETFNGHTDSKPKGPEAMSLDILMPSFEHVYGLPERATNLALKPTIGGMETEPYRLYNLDVFEYVHNSPFGLYGSIPFMLGHRAGLTVGVLWLNAAEMFVDVTKTPQGMASQWIAESGVVDLFVMTGPGPAEVMRQYAVLTGTTALPQMFSIGYHQCRWNYKDEADVKQVDSGFDQHGIPYDVLWLDIEHTNGKRYMTWDHSLFPNPVGMQEDLASRGRKMVTIVDPHVKRDSSYSIFSEAERLGHFVKNKHNTDFDGWCWPGSSSYLDVTSPAVREWWASYFTTDKYVGSTKNLYIWNDMNEPSVFNGPEITMQKDNLHWQGVEHRDVHNLYGLYYHMGTAEGLKLRGYANIDPQDGDRPFVLSRAFFSGTQRVGPIWTGDNAADWNHLKVSLPMLMTLGITGLPFSGADVGGFFGNPDVELLTRWYQVGAFYPFFRGHAHLETQRREPWLFGEEATRRVRDAVRSRYAMLPYIYTLFRHANVTGDAIMRPTWYDFPNEKDTFALEEQFMLGPGVLVRPVLEARASQVDVLLPRVSRWFSALSGAEQQKTTWLPGLDQAHKIQVDMDSIPVFYRGGYIIPRRERPRRSTSAMSSDPYTLVVALDHHQAATGDLYIDDGSSFAFQRGMYLHRAFSYKDGILRSSKYVQPGVPDGSLASTLQVERVVFLGLPSGHYKYRLPDGRVGELEAGPLHARAPASKAAFSLRLAGLPLAQDWSVTITKA